MDFKSVAAAGSRLGTGTMVVMDDATCPVGFVHNLQHFFAQESCGWCTPCREGLPWVEKILLSMEQGNGREEDLEIIANAYPFSWTGQYVLRPGTRRYGTIAKCIEIFQRRF